MSNEEARKTAESNAGAVRAGAAQRARQRNLRRRVRPCNCEVAQPRVSFLFKQVGSRALRRALAAFPSSLAPVHLGAFAFKRLPLIDLHTQESVARAEGMSKSSCVQAKAQGTISCPTETITPRLTSRVATDKQYAPSTKRCQPGAEAGKLTATEPGRTVAACNLAGSRGV